ncbi:hypothetical protein ESA94_20540 [Lacibacter luteus]|uniref:Glyoxalase/fosfomycin resistance/dioxygenase domain-containing protein n=1 Tax=Lacibacter luteus TaxID=2508719 RepID=A0A4Q1CDM7_9BACT|nr:VOC family protein [Lacibacter luteus]RXK57589.1 hypothetical protein ESA94_20540 [Lacibacter luteus]
MTECVPFLLVKNIPAAIAWYEQLGFSCVATNLIWEPDCEINWARIEWDGAAFMIGPDERSVIADKKDTGLWFNVVSIDAIFATLIQQGIETEFEAETFYGRSVVSFKDLDGFVVSFSCEVKKQ